MTKKSFYGFPDMVDFYQSVLQQSLLEELKICRNIVHSEQFSDWERAEIILMGGHQWRLAAGKMTCWRNTAIERLEAAALWKRSYKDFEEVYDVVCKTIADVKYVGPLAWYDVAKRLAYCCGLEPMKLVYLCSGAKSGAKALLGDKQVKGDKMEAVLFGKYFPGLSAMHLENILCIMKHVFKDGKVDKDAEISVGCCLRWTCSKELRDKYEKLFPSGHEH